LHGAIAAIKILDVTNVDAPMEEVKQYLLAKYRARFECHPRLFEQTVKSVFGALGFRAEATAYSRDGGVDVILRHGDGTTTGIQVKRSRNPVDVEQIRSLAGALVQGGHTTGVFVTTSRFTRDARQAGETFERRGYPIELIDARRFFEALRVSQRAPYEGYKDWYAAHGEPDLQTVYEDE
jgi:restriction system protein